MPTPGSSALEDLEGLKRRIEEGEHPPIPIKLELGNERITIYPEDLGDINVIRGKNPNDDFAEVKIIIRANKPWIVKVPKGVFLKDLNK